MLLFGAYFILHFRSSRLEVFYKKGVLRNFAKLTGKHLCQGLFFIKVASLRQPLESVSSKTRPMTLEYCFILMSLYWLFSGFEFLIFMFVAKPFFLFYYLQTSRKAYGNFYLVPFEFQ